MDPSEHEVALHRPPGSAGPRRHVGLILALLVNAGSWVADPFAAREGADRGPGPVPTGEEVTPRWRLERLRPRDQAAVDDLERDRRLTSRGDRGR